MFSLLFLDAGGLKAFLQNPVNRCLCAVGQFTYCFLSVTLWAIKCNLFQVPHFNCITTHLCL
jgi:hypothetical protein